MNQFCACLALQWKRCAKALLGFLCILAAAAALITGIFLVMIRLLTAQDGLSLIRTAVVIPDEDIASQYALQFISSMDSVKSVCEFEYTDKEKALNGFRDGTYQAAVVLPENFYHDVQVGLNPPALVYFPEDPGLVGSLFRELLVTGVSYLQSAEAGVYAVLDTALEHDTGPEIGEIGNIVALSYVNAIFSRDKIFEEETVSALGEMSLSSYYYCAGMILCLMFSGLLYSFMHGRNASVINDALKIRGMNGFLRFLSRILVMFPVTFAFAMLFYLGGKGAGLLEEETGTMLPVLLVISLTVSLYFDLIYVLAGSGKAGMFVLVILNLIGAACSGLILPRAYLADWTGVIGTIMPMKYWMILLCKGFQAFAGGLPG